MTPSPRHATPPLPAPSSPRTPPETAHGTITLPVASLLENSFSINLYGDPNTEIDDLLESIQTQGILVPLVVTPDHQGWEVLSGHRRLACARALDMAAVPCHIRIVGSGTARRQAVLDYNRQRRKIFTQLMREADALEEIISLEAKNRRSANLSQFKTVPAPDSKTIDLELTRTRNPDRLNSDARTGRTDAAIARAIGLGGKDLYRQARAVWRAAQVQDPRALAAITALDNRTKSIHAAYKDLRRRDRFSAGFKPTPYDVWPFRQDPAYGVPHPGSIPAALVAHLLHYYTRPGDLVVDPMAGGGTTRDVCEAMGRQCLAYDIHTVRSDIEVFDVKNGFTPGARGCRLIFCDPPYHTMLARRYGDGAGTLAEEPLRDWIAFLQTLAVDAFATLQPGGFVALLLANQTEKDLPAGHGYLDHAFLGYQALRTAGFLPERRISCPMSGGYLPQHIQRARASGRLLGLVRDLVVMRKPDLADPQSFPVYLTPEPLV